MSLKSKALGLAYRNVLKPIVFNFDPETIHNIFVGFGEKLENKRLLSLLFAYENKCLEKEVLGVKFENPIGLAAGFDYDGHLAQVLKFVGFGFNTVGTVTAKPYLGNPKPRLLRLPKSGSVLVNKGFKSEGAVAVSQRLDQKRLDKHTIGISIGSTNTFEINTINKAINDYLFTFDLFNKKEYVQYFELNISCPNTGMTESFATEVNFENLIKAVVSLGIPKPIFVKMPNEIEMEKSDSLVRIALKQGIRGFIFSNLLKDRGNEKFDKKEIEKMKLFKGNFSGRPTFQNSNNLISHTRKMFGKEVVIIGCGGIFSPQDALIKLCCGADLVQLITGMIFQGPQLIGEICQELSKKSTIVDFL